MALRRILVIDESAAIRETLTILLGSLYEVRALRTQELTAGLAADAADLIIVGAAERGAVGERLPPGLPVLWLADEPDAVPAARSAVQDFLPRRFSPLELRRRVDQLLARGSRWQPGERARQILEPPYVPAGAARILRQACAHDLPLFLFGEPGVGKRSLARALHTARGGGTFVALRGDSFSSDPLPVGGARKATLFIDRVDRLEAQGQQRLLGLLEPNGIVLTPSGVRMHLITATEVDLAPLVEQGAFSRELFHRVTVLSASLPPLRERRQDVAALADVMARDLCRWMGLATVTFSRSAQERLSNYLWFGNIAELEAVVARTLSLSSQPVIEADDLLFESSQASPVARAVTAPVGAAEKRRSLAPEVLDLIINELAHEFKNPMVTIKTFAQHLRRFLQGGASEEEVARLTGEAVDQMDHVLENLVQFTRFGAPDPQPVPLSTVLSSVIDDLAELPGPHRGYIDYEAAPPVLVRADPAQVTYALTNLLRAVTRGLAAHDPVTVRHHDPADVVIVLPGGADPLGGHLAELIDSADGRQAPLPLGVAIAGALVERNGGSLTLDSTGRPTTITVRFPVFHDKEAKVAGNGESARSDH